MKDRSLLPSEDKLVDYKEHSGLPTIWSLTALNLYDTIFLC